MAKQDHEAREVHESLKVRGSVLPSSHEAPEVVKPRDEPLDLPPAPVSSQRTAILGSAFAGADVRRDHLDAVLAESFIEGFAVVRLIADQSDGLRLREPAVHDLADRTCSPRHVVTVAEIALRAREEFMPRRRARRDSRPWRSRRPAPGAERRAPPPRPRARAAAPRAGRLGRARPPAPGRRGRPHQRSA